MISDTRDLRLVELWESDSGTGYNYDRKLVIIFNPHAELREGIEHRTLHRTSLK